MAAGNKRKRLIRYGKYKPRRRNNIPHEDDSMSWFPASQDIDQSQKPPPLPPKKPGSQKEAMMAAEPPADKVQNMMEFTGMDRSTAVKYLKVGGIMEAFGVHHESLWRGHVLRFN